MSANQEELLDELRRVEVLRDLTGEQLRWILNHAEIKDFGDGEIIVRIGDAADHLQFLAKGRVQVNLLVHGDKVQYFTLKEGETSGLLPFSRMKTYGGEITAVGPTRMFWVHRDNFTAMLDRIPPLGQRLVALMSTRIRETTRFQQQREKLEALGKIAAGLAHELNNPASSIVRNASELQARLHCLPEQVSRLSAHAVPADFYQDAKAYRMDLLKKDPVAIAALERSRNEDEIIEWLEERSITEPWLLAETFVSAGVTTSCLEKYFSAIQQEALPDLVQWFECMVAADNLLKDISIAAGRISELVQAVKTYSYMDRSLGKQPIDVHEGIENTLVILNYKLKKKGIQLKKTYASNLPPISAHPGELNQVWTNLLCNASDAVDEGGVIHVQTGMEAKTVFVKIIDNGHGIPDEIQSKIFEPFFTTKDVGMGAGLGLDIVDRIVTQQHHGRITVSSQPGHTEFTVWIPVS